MKTGCQGDISTLMFSKPYSYTCIHIHIHTGIVFNHDKEGNPAICNNTNGPWRHKSQVIQSGKDKYHMTLLTCATWKSQPQKTVKWWLSGPGRVGNRKHLFKDTNLQLVVNKFWRSKAQDSKDRQWHCIISIKLAKRPDLNYFNHKKEIIIM